MTFGPDDYRRDVIESLCAARQHVADAMYALERCHEFKAASAVRDAVDRAASILAAGEVLAMTPQERKRRAEQ